jgi:hypothetical protein
MADLADVMNVLVKRAECAVYPNGVLTSQGVKIPSITGTDIVVYPGWPSSDNLDQDLAAGKTHVSVFPKVEERNTTRYRRKQIVTKSPVSTLTLSIQTPNGGNIELEAGGNLILEGSGNLELEGDSLTVVVGGTVSVPQNVMLRINGNDYVYGVQASDTLNTIAAALAALVAVDVAGTSAQGSSINIGPTGRVQAARVGAFGTVVREIRRQERIFMVTVWAGTPSLRDTIAAAIDTELAAQEFLTMPDGYAARLIYKNSPVVDALQKAVVYRRDLNYSVEFATTISEQAAAVIAPKLTINQITVTA